MEVLIHDLSFRKQIVQQLICKLELTIDKKKETHARNTIEFAGAVRQCHHSIVLIKKGETEMARKKQEHPPSFFPS